MRLRAMSQPYHARKRPVPVLLVSLLLLGSLPRGAPAQESAGFEDPPVLAASEILPPELLRGDRFSVREEVRNDGFMNYYGIDSDFGPFDAYSITTLKLRVHEIHALATLEEISETDVFLEAVQRSATGQVETLRAFGDKPVETVKGMPDGIRRGFKRVRRDANDAYRAAKQAKNDATEVVTGDGDDREGDQGEDDGGSSREEKTDEAAGKSVEAAEKYALQYFGVTQAERRWAQKLEVDPYTPNEVLRREIKRVSRVDAATSFGMRFAPIPRIPGVDYLGMVTQMVWTLDPRELREQNIKRLVEMGLDQGQVEVAFNNPHFSPSLQTLTTAILGELGEVTGKEKVIGGMQQADTREHAIFFVTSLRLASWYHKTHQPLGEILAAYPAPLARTGDDRLVGFGAFEYLSWTEPLANVANLRMSLAGERGGVQKELWIEGGISDRCRAEAEGRGWEVFVNIQVADPKAAGDVPEAAGS